MIDKKDRVGEKRPNNRGFLMKIVAYRNAKEVDVQFEDGTIVYDVQYDNFKRGKVVNPFSPNVYGVGFIGTQKCNHKENPTYNSVYNTWNNMLKRCYSEKQHLRTPTYTDCTVCDEWHNFQVFSEWYNDNIWNENFTNLDKDIIIKRNKLYSPESCVLVDSRINSLFIKCNKTRGAFPIGVCKEGNKFIAQIRYKGNVHIRLGLFNTPIEAFNSYKQAKESYIKQVADEYKLKYPNFPEKLYEAMYRYQVEIDD